MSNEMNVKCIPITNPIGYFYFEWMGCPNCGKDAKYYHERNEIGEKIFHKLHPKTSIDGWKWLLCRCDECHKLFWAGDRMIERFFTYPVKSSDEIELNLNLEI